MFLMETTWLSQHLLPCPFKHFTGIDCPGCGMQRSVLALFQGNVEESFRFHPAGPLVVITLVVLVLHLKFQWKNGARWLTWLYILTTAITLGQYIAKWIWGFDVWWKI